MSDAVKVKRVVRPTHWKDDRGFALTDGQRADLSSDWQHAYNVPCKVGAFGRITPLHKCLRCDGKGRDPEFTYDPCPVCGKSGGTPTAPADQQQT